MPTVDAEPSASYNSRHNSLHAPCRLAGGLGAERQTEQVGCLLLGRCRIEEGAVQGAVQPLIAGMRTRSSALSRTN